MVESVVRLDLCLNNLSNLIRIQVILFLLYLKDTLMTTVKRSSDVAGIFWQAALISCMVVWRSFRSDVIALWFTVAQW